MVIYWQIIAVLCVDRWGKNLSKPPKTHAADEYEQFEILLNH
jgi:hypothetical protein